MVKMNSNSAKNSGQISRQEQDHIHDRVKFVLQV